MKHLLTIIFLFSLCSTVFANPDFTMGKWYNSFKSESYRCSVRFWENKTVEFSEGIDYPFGHDFWDKTYKYTAKGSKGMYEIVLDNGMKFNALASRHYLVLYEQEKTEPFFIGGIEISVEMTGLNFVDITASSFLTEKNVLYKVENLNNLRSDSPWVEGAKGYGIGESLTFTTNMSGLVFFSGYVSLKNPSLYEKNSRVRKAKFTCTETGKFVTWDFADTAGGQQIDLSDLIQYDGKHSITIQMKILDVYKGTKYADTCINSMFVGFSRLE